MKNVMRMLGVVILLLSGICAKASDSLSVRVKDNHNLLINLQEVSEGTELLFKDNRGEVLFRDSIKSNESYRKILNLEVIPMGTYYFSLERENRIEVTVLEKDWEGLEIKEDVSGVVFKPNYKVENERVEFFLTNPKRNKIQVRVYDEVGVEVGSVSSSDAVVTKTLDFSKVPAGNYFLKVNTKDGNFSKKLAFN